MGMHREDQNELGHISTSHFVVWPMNYNMRRNVRGRSTGIAEQGCRPGRFEVTTMLVTLQARLISFCEEMKEGMTRP